MQVRDGIRLAAQAVGVIIVTAVIAATALYGLFAGIVYMILSVDCAPEVNRSIPSPDGKLAAVVYTSRSCILSNDTTNISIDPRTRRFTPENSTPFFVVEESPGFNIRWTNDRTLQVTVPWDRRVHKRERTADGVTIEYK